MDGMPVVGLADYLTKTAYGTCADAAEPRGRGSCNVRAVFDGLDLSHMAPFVEKGACRSARRGAVIFV
jgi:hypothetical protein